MKQSSKQLIKDGCLLCFQIHCKLKVEQPSRFGSHMHIRVHWSGALSTQGVLLCPNACSHALIRRRRCRLLSIADGCQSHSHRPGGWRWFVTDTCAQSPHLAALSLSILHDGAEALSLRRLPKTVTASFFVASLRLKDPRTMIRPNHSSALHKVLAQRLALAIIGSYEV